MNIKALSFLSVFLFTLNSFCQTEPEVVITTGHSAVIQEMDMSSDGKYMATGANNKIIKIWDVPTGREFRTLSGNDGRINHISFSPDNLHIAAVINHGSVKVWEIKTGKVIKELPAEEGKNTITWLEGGKKIVFKNDDTKIEIADVFGSEASKFIPLGFGYTLNVNEKKKEAYSLDIKGNLVTFSLETLTETGRFQVFDHFNVPFSNVEISPNGKYLVGGFNDDFIYMIDIEQKKIAWKTPKQTRKIQKLHFDKKGRYFYTWNMGDLYRWDSQKKELVSEFKSEGYNSIQALVSHPKQDLLVEASTLYGKIRYRNVKTGEYVREFASKVNSIVSMDYSPNGKFIATASDKVKIKIWNLKNNKAEIDIMGFFPVIFGKSSDVVYAMTYDMKIGKFNIHTGKRKGNLDCEGELIQKLAISADGKFLAGAGFLGIIRIWDLETKKVVRKITGHVGGIYGLAFNPDGTHLASSGMDATLRIWDLKSGKELHQKKDQIIVISDVNYSPDGKYLASASWDKTINLYDTKGYSLLKTLEGHTNMIYDIDFSHDGSLLVSSAGNNVVSAADNSIIVWNIPEGTQKCKFEEHTDAVTKVVFDSDTYRIVSSSNDGTTIISDAGTCETVATLISFGKEDFALILPDNYYMASREALKSISFRINGELYPFDQFDLRLNRPDIVGARIGKTSPGLLKAYQYVYKKRLRKMGFKEEDLGKDYHLPSISLENEKDISVVTDKNSVLLKVKAWDDLYTLDRINVYVNDVPVYGSSGISVKESKVKSILKDIEVPLIPGNNEVSISTLNSKGVESLSKTINIVNQGDEKQGDLYVISIGVSKYKDERFQLTYPSKDAADIINSLEGSMDLFKEIHVKKLIDDEVTLENIEDLKEYLKDARPEDVVVIFIAGHGVLDADFNYYFGTYDMDFDHPEGRGLAYEKLDKIMDAIKSLKKILIMDTCHSGEIDEEEVEAGGPSPEVIEGDVEFRAAGAGVRQKEGIGVENSVELMQDLFSDLRKGSGATVISSAGGAEYAMESAEWKNGLFTYCFLEGLNSKRADLNGDGEVYISELRQYVYEKVNKLSNGKQKPTARIENIRMDYRIK